MQRTILLINLFKSYCCSQLWKSNSSGFDQICKSWNIAIRLILGLPYHTHTYLVGSLMGQTGIREQLYISNFFFVCGMTIVQIVILYNSNTCIV